MLQQCEECGREEKSKTRTRPRPRPLKAHFNSCCFRFTIQTLFATRPRFSRHITSRQFIASHAHTDKLASLAFTRSITPSALTSQHGSTESSDHTTHTAHCTTSNSTAARRETARKDQWQEQLRYERFRSLGSYSRSASAIPEGDKVLDLRDFGQLFSMLHNDLKPTREYI